MCKNQKYTSPVNGYTHLDLPYREVTVFIYVNSAINVLPHYPALGHIWGFQTAESTDP